MHRAPQGRRWEAIADSDLVCTGLLKATRPWNVRSPRSALTVISNQFRVWQYLSSHLPAEPPGPELAHVYICAYVPMFSYISSMYKLVREQQRARACRYAQCLRGRAHIRLRVALLVEVGRRRVRD